MRCTRLAKKAHGRKKESGSKGADAARAGVVSEAPKSLKAKLGVQSSSWSVLIKGLRLETKAP